MTTNETTAASRAPAKKLLPGASEATSTTMNPLCNKGGHRRNGGRAVAMRLLSGLLTIALLIPGQIVNADGRITSGTTRLSNTLQYGNTAYYVNYSYPSTAEVGTNLTIPITLLVISLTGLIEYITNYRLVVDVFVGGQHVLNGSIIGGSAIGGANSSFLFPGATWGPNNITIPLTADNTGLSKGQSANATVIIILSNMIKYGGQVGVFTTEPAMQGQAGNLVIQNAVAPTTGQGTGQAYLPYALLASGAVLMVLAVVLLRGPQAPRGK